MLSCVTVPDGLPEVWEALCGVFSAPTFAVFKALVEGILAGTAEHAVTGMWIAAGLAGRRHWSAAHRFFSHARWDLDALGLRLAALAVARFAPHGPLTVVVDDTLFARYGKTVFAAFYQHDGSARGRDGLGRGNCFVIAGLSVAVPWMRRRVLLPVLFRLNLGKHGPSKPDQARTMVGLLARAFPHRHLDVVADALYRSAAWRELPERITFTTRLASNAALCARAPEPTARRPGHPVWKGPKLGTLRHIAESATWRAVPVHAYAETLVLHVATVECLWWGSLHRTPVRLILARDPGSKKPYDIALITTDLAASAAELVCRYSWRWAIEQTIRDCKIIMGVGQARNRLQRAVERTVPFQMLCLTILFCWYPAAPAGARALDGYRREHPWHRHKTHASVDDMLIAFRHARINHNTAAHNDPGQFSDTQVSDLLTAT
jgi:hypothetical protein